MTAPFHIRIAELNEASAVIDLYRGYDHPPERELTPSEIERIFVEINEKGYIAVALADDLAVGTYSMYFCANLAHAGRPFAVIENVIVAQHNQREGIGSALMTHAQETARNKGCYKVMLATGTKRPQNLRFYEACGFIGDKTGFQIRF